MSETAPFVLVPVDGTEAAKRAVDVGVLFARALRCPLQILAAVDADALSPRVRMSPLFVEAFEAAAHEHVDDAVRRAVAAGVAATGHVRHGDVLGVLLDHAAESLLVVLGRTHHSAIDRAIAGSVGRALVTRSPVPAVLVGATDTKHAITSVQALVDGSPSGDRAAAWGARMAAATGAALELVCTGEDAAAVLDEVERRVPGCAGARTTALRGPVVDGLLDHAETVRPSLVVVGRFGRTDRRRYFEGSVVRGFTEHGAAPLVVVP